MTSRADPPLGEESRSSFRGTLVASLKLTLPHTQTGHCHCAEMEENGEIGGGGRKEERVCV